MRSLISLTAVAILCFIACEKSAETEQVCKKPSDTTTLYSANQESLDVRRFEIDQKIAVAKSLLAPISAENVSRKLTIISASEPIYYENSKRDNPRE